MISVRGVSKTFTASDRKELLIIDNVSVDINDGEFVTIIGPSGCGKSTLLNIMSGLMQPDKGEILVDGRAMNRPRPEALSMVFQDPGVFPWRDVRGNVEFPLELRHVGKARRRELSAKFISLVGLSGFERFHPGQLSGGMQQRVNLARALVTEPEILLMDEPFGALDELSRLKMANELTSIWEKTKLTVVFVTHSLTEAAYLSDRIIVSSPRPSRIKSIIDVKTPRPRDFEDEELVVVKKKLWDMLANTGEAR